MIEVLNNISFKTIGYRKNFDLISVNDSIVTEYAGNVSLLRFIEHKTPLNIGDYDFSVWNIGLAKKLKANTIKIIKSYKHEMLYRELKDLVLNGKFTLQDYDKVVLIHNLILHPNYRKIGVTQEFIEFLYRDFYDEKTAIVAFVYPMQNNDLVYDTYVNHMQLMPGYDSIPVAKYFSLKALSKKTDTELNTYKLFSVANKCGFKRIDESHLFLLNPEKPLQRIIDKHKKK